MRLTESPLREAVSFMAAPLSFNLFPYSNFVLISRSNDTRYSLLHFKDRKVFIWNDYSSRQRDRRRQPRYYRLVYLKYLNFSPVF